MCNPGPSCWLVRYIYVSDAGNSSNFSVNAPWNYGGMCNNHARPLSLYPSVPYFHASGYSVTVVVVNTVFFIGAIFL